jgi:isopenicillin N synthase-like dioxygenase
MVSENADKIADNVSNSYQRIIRYLEPRQLEEEESGVEKEEDAAFWPHVDSTFLTLIPMPEIGGLEVWCPSLELSESENLVERGEWVRPIKPVGFYGGNTNDEVTSAQGDDCLHVVALAGEFMQLLSNGQVPTCIHRVIAPQPPSPPAFGFAPKQYKPRVSAPLFLRPRRDEDAILDVESDLRKSGEGGLYYEKNLLHECDSMRVWDYMDCMSPNN